MLAIQDARKEWHQGGAGFFTGVGPQRAVSRAVSALAAAANAKSAANING
jgi:hypothetical protein